MISAIVITAAVIIFIWWNVSLVGYRDRDTHDIETDESKCFHPNCRPIVLKHETKPKTAILMIHGFPSTPYGYTYCSHEFYDMGYDTYAPLLPGFGTSVDDFSKTCFTQWFNYISRYYERLKSEYENVAIIGTSMGGSMTLKLGEKYSDTDKEPLCIVSLDAPVVYNSLIRDGICTQPAFYIARTIRLFVSRIRAKEKAGSWGEDGAEDWTGYGGVFIDQGISFVKALRTIRKELGKITVPLFSIHETQDRTVSVKNQGIIERETNSRDFLRLTTDIGEFNNTHHILLMYHSVQKDITYRIADFIRKNETR